MARDSEVVVLVMEHEAAVADCFHVVSQSKDHTGEE